MIFKSATRVDLVLNPHRERVLQPIATQSYQGASLEK